jgi:S-formylglutathione hydrolase FrmB
VRRVSRRALLAGAGGLTLGAASTAAAVEAGIVPGRSWAYHRLGLDGADGVVPDVEAGPVVDGSFASAARLGQECGYAVAYPPGYGPGDRLPVAVVLHGRRNDHASAFAPAYLALDAFLAAAVADGTAPYALASVDGGDSYWHTRASGEDSAAMVTDELVPLLASLGLDTRRLGLLGWSMGGFGALHVARLLGPSRVAAVSASSPSLWHEYDDTSPGAFDDRSDFAGCTPFGRQHDLDGIAVRIDCGQGDPFWSASRDYADGFADRPAGGFERGDHDLGYWRRMAPAHMTFVGAWLARTGT